MPSRWQDMNLRERPNLGFGEQRSSYGTRSITAPLLPNTRLRDQSTHERGLDQNRHDPPYGAKARLSILRQVLKVRAFNQTTAGVMEISKWISMLAARSCNHIPITSRFTLRTHNEWPGQINRLGYPLLGAQFQEPVALHLS